HSTIDMRRSGTHALALGLAAFALVSSAFVAFAGLLWGNEPPMRRGMRRLGLAAHCPCTPMDAVDGLRLRRAGLGSPLLRCRLPWASAACAWRACVRRADARVGPQLLGKRLEGGHPSSSAGLRCRGGGLDRRRARRAAQPYRPNGLNGLALVETRTLLVSRYKSSVSSPSSRPKPDCL